MTGLESILLTIEQDARENAKHTVDTAKQEAEKILSQARLEADAQKDEAGQACGAKAKELMDRARSAAQLQQRRELLSVKQELISQVIQEAKQQLADLPAENYFEVLLKLAEKYATQSGGTMLLSSRDLGRLPASFQEQLSARTGKNITIGQEAASISNGFLLLYGGIDINCSFDALFEDLWEVLQDKVHAILFPQ
jgi:V/A-type H+-transporting ATPase subunit E